MDELFAYLNPLAKNYVRRGAPDRMKRMVASGKLPLPPQQLILALLFLAREESDSEIGRLALSTLREQPAGILNSVLESQTTPPPALRALAEVFSDDDRILEKILLNPNTPVETFYSLAQRLENPNLLEQIALNQRRQLEKPAIIGILLQNPALSDAYKARILEFALRQRLDIGTDPRQFLHLLRPELIEELAPEHREPPPTERKDPAEGPAHPLEESRAEKAPFPGMSDARAGEPALEFEGELMEEGDLDLPLEFTEEDDFDDTSSEAAEEEQRKNRSLPIEKVIHKWGVTDKIKAALRGNKQVRSILIRDGNRQVALSVLENPRLTEEEVIKIAASRNVSKDVIRAIARNKEWVKNYKIKLSLVMNPKCPIDIALKLLNYIQEKDLKQISKSKNVSGQISAAARRMLAMRKK